MNLKRLLKVNDESSVKMPICIDFDGTIVVNRFPDIGDENPHALEVLKKWQDAGAGLVLSTMRSGEYLQNAVAWCRERGLEFYGVNADPNQSQWTESSKPNGIFSVDDRNLGVPLTIINGQSCVDWALIDSLFTAKVIQRIKDYNFKEWLRSSN